MVANISAVLLFLRIHSCMMQCGSLNLRSVTFVPASEIPEGVIISANEAVVDNEENDEDDELISAREHLFFFAQSRFLRKKDTRGRTAVVLRAAEDTVAPLKAEKFRPADEPYFSSLPPPVITVEKFQMTPDEVVQESLEKLQALRTRGMSPNVIVVLKDIPNESPTDAEARLQRTEADLVESGRRYIAQHGESVDSLAPFQAIHRLIALKMLTITFRATPNPRMEIEILREMLSHKEISYFEVDSEVHAF